MKNFVEKYDPQVQRALEMLPGITAWLVILFPLWGALLIPKVVAYFTIAFLVYWFYRSFQSAILGTRGYFKVRQSERTNWYRHYLKGRKPNSLKWQEIRHLVIIPNVNEPIETLARNLNCLAKQKNISPDQLWVVLAMEERVTDCRERAKKIIKQFEGKFGRLLATFHPANLPGEIIGKASNETWAAKEARKLFVDEEGHDIKKITLTSCDADACFHPQYFSALTYHFALNPNRYYRFWQSPVFWHNNFWRVPAFTRIVGTLGNIIHIASLQELHAIYFNYSAYSSSLKMIDDVGYWHTDIIPEDWHIFLQCFFHKEGKVEVEPIFLPTNIDAPEGKNYLQSLKNRYKQCQRHAWGATDIPYAIKQAFKHPEIPAWSRFFRISKMVESHLIWSTNWFILTLGAWIPALINPAFHQTTLGYNLPKISQIVLTICLLFLLITIVLDIAFRPKRPKESSRWFPIFEYSQWLLMPIATLFMAVLPGLDAQTRLMLGKRLEYWVTEKV